MYIDVKNGDPDGSCSCIKDEETAVDVWLCVAYWKDPKAKCAWDKSKFFKRAKATFDGKAGEDLLAHEQGHIDICKKWAKELQEQLKKIVGYALDRVKLEAQKKAIEELKKVSQDTKMKAGKAYNAEQKAWEQPQK